MAGLISERWRQQGVFSAFYAAQFVLLGVQLPFFSGWLVSRGFAIAEIGMLTGVALVARLILAPAYGFWADRLRDPRTAIRIAALVFALGGVILAAPVGKAAIAIASLLVMWSFGMLVPLTDTAVARADRVGALNYGQTRAFGSAVFLMTTILAGRALADSGFDISVTIMAVAALATFAISLALPKGVPTAGAKAVTISGALALFRSRTFILFIAAAGSIQGAHAAYYSFSVLHWQGLGFSTAVIGWLWATGVVAEIFVLTLARGLLRRISPLMLIAIGGAASLVRWLAIAAEPPLALLFIVQLLHAATFAVTYVGSIELITRAAPPALANTAMTIKSATGVGAATGLASIAAGFLLERHGAIGAYGLMAAMGATGALCALWLARSGWSGRFIEQQSCDDLVQRPRP